MQLKPRTTEETQKTQQSYWCRLDYTVPFHGNVDVDALPTLNNPAADGNSFVQFVYTYKH